MHPRTPTVAIAVVLIASAVLYTLRLDRVPPFLSTDETAFALQAHAIATTAHDTNGRFLPLYFQVFENAWFHPALVYAMTPVLAVVRPTAWAVRLPTVMVALCNILLSYALARRLGVSLVAALSASVFVALTPVHLLHGRFAADYLFPLPCVLAWFILLVDANRSQSSTRFLAAGCALGLGLYTYIASLAMMPVYLLLTYLTLFATGARGLRPYALVTAGFVVLVLPLALYLLAKPEVYAGFVARYGGTNVELDVLHHPRSVFSTHLVTERWPIYASFFERPFLFDHAETHIMSSTYTSGILLKAMKVLLPFGVFHILWNRRNAFTALLLATFLSAPIAASLIPEKYAIDRALMLVPSAALIAGFGVDWLLAPRPAFVMWPARAVCVGLLVWIAVQFQGFYRDYLTTYPITAGFWFDGNHPGAFEPLVRQHPPDDPRFIYLSGSLPRINDHWKRYLLSRGRADLLKRTIVFAQEDIHLSFVRPGSLLLTGVDDPVERAFLKMPAVTVATRIKELDGSPSFTIFERTPLVVYDRFDGKYSVKMDVVCQPATSRAVCMTAPTTASCPSMETIAVASNLVLDSCGYLGQAAVADDGSYTGQSIFGVAVKGTFATTGTFRLSGVGESRESRYEVSFTLTKRN